MNLLSLGVFDMDDLIKGDPVLMKYKKTSEMKNFVLSCMILIVEDGIVDYATLCIRVISILTSHLAWYWYINKTFLTEKEIPRDLLLGILRDCLIGAHRQQYDVIHEDGRLRVIALSLSPSCVTREKSARKKWPRGGGTVITARLL